MGFGGLCSTKARKNTSPQARYAMVLRSHIERLFRVDVSPLQSALARGRVTFLHGLTVAAEKFQDDQLSLRATSLTYTTLLSLVPFLAVAFSVLKAFGVQNQLEPTLARLLEALGPEAAEITQRVLAFVDHQHVGALGALGVAGLF
jgi:membrane protein